MLRAVILGTASLAAAALLALPVLAAPSAQTIRVSEKSYRISLSDKPRAGTAKFVVRNVMIDSIGDRYQRDEVIVLIAEFFDRLVYATAKGYEEAREHWTDLKLMA